MKKQVSFLIAIFGLLFIQAARAQTYKVKLANNPGNTIEFILSQSSISIQGYNGNQVIIKNTDYHAPPKRAKGLHAIGGNGPGNTGIGFSVYKENGYLKVVQTLMQGGDFKVKVPNQVRIKIERRRLPGSDIQICDHKGEIVVRTLTGDIDLKNVTGPVVAHSTSGDINVVFSHLSDAAPSSISVISGHIDITLPASTKADLRLSTLSGNIYTDFNIVIRNGENGLTQIVGHDVRGTINGGGVELKLKTISGNIYLRKR